MVGSGSILSFELGSKTTRVVLTAPVIQRADPDLPALWYGYTKVRGGGRREVVVKIQRMKDGRQGNVIESEADVYEWLQFDQSHDLQDIRVPVYYGRTVVDTASAIALERAAGSMADVLAERDRSDDRSGELLEHLAALAAFATVETLLSMADVRTKGRQAGGRPVPFHAHRDIRPENVLIRHWPDQGYDALLADFGLVLAAPLSTRGQIAMGLAAPEQRGTNRPSTLETDLWQVGLMLWRILHDGMTPFVDVDGSRLDLIDPQVQDIGNPLPWDTSHDASQDPVLTESVPLRLARALLVEGGMKAREKSARAMLPEIVQAHREAQTALNEDALAQQLEVIFAPKTSQTPAQEPTTAGFTSAAARIIGLAPRTTARGTTAKPESPARRASPPPWLAWRRRAAGGLSAARRVAHVLAHSLGVASIGLGTAGLTATLALFIGWSQLMPIPSEEIDVLVRWIGAGALALAAIIVCAVVVARRLATPLNRRRRVELTTPLIAAFAAPALAFTIVTSVLAQSVDASGVAVLAAAGGLAGVAAGRNPLRPRGPLHDAEAASARARGEAMRRVRPVFTCLIAAGGVLAVGATLFAPGGVESLSNHAIRTETAALVPGAPGGDPVFINPHTIAVNDRGDVAVVDRVGVGRDVVWLVPADAQREPIRLLSTLSWRPQAEGTLADIPDAEPLGWTQSILTDLAIPNRGPSVRSIRSLAFWSEESLLLIGEDGVTRLDFDLDSPASSTRTTRVTSALTGNNIGTRIATDGRFLYVLDAETAPALTEVFCDYQEQVMPSNVVWWFDPTAENPQPAVLQRHASVGGSSAECIDAPSTIFSDSEGVHLIGARLLDGKYKLTMTMIDPAGDAPGTPSTLGGKVTVLPELVSNGNSSLSRAATSGGRLIALQQGSYCLGVVRTSGEEAKPAMTDAAIHDGVPADRCAGLPAEWSTDNAAALPAVADDSELSVKEWQTKAAELKSACSTVQATSNLLYTSAWLPMASGGPRGSAYVVSQAGVGCTTTIFRLDPESVEFQPAPNLSSQPKTINGYVLGETAIMSATKPQMSGEVILWNAPALGRIASGPYGTGFLDINTFSAYSNQPRMVLRASDDLRVELGTNEDTDATELAVLRRDEASGTDATVRIAISGLTDMVIHDEQFYIARCGQIFSTSIENLLALPAGTPESPLVDPARLPTKMLVGDGSITDPCTAPTEKPSAGETVLAAAELAPVALEVSSVDGDVLVTYAEVGLFGNEEVSRIRVADLAASTLRTVGYDPDNPEHTKESNDYTGELLLGDIGRLGLVPTDVSRSPDGRLAVATASSDGTGPVLLLRDGGLTAIELDGTREVTGLTWGAQVVDFEHGDADGDGFTDEVPLVITDGTEGDLMVLSLPPAGAHTGTAWRQEVLEGVGLTWWAQALQPPE
jgi:hypothetical protein